MLPVFDRKVQSLQHSVHPLPFLLWGGGGGVEPPTKFSKRGGGLDRALVFRGGLVGKRGGDLFEEGLQFLHKK